MDFSQITQEFVALRRRKIAEHLSSEESQRLRELQQALLLAQVETTPSSDNDRPSLRLQDGDRVVDRPFTPNEKGLLDLDLDQPWMAGEERVVLLSPGAQKEVRVIRCTAVENVERSPVRVLLRPGASANENTI